MPFSDGASWLSLMYEVSLLRAPLAFGRAHANFTLSEGGAVASRTAAESSDDYRAAASTVVMRSGCHFAQFTVLSGIASFGVIRPGWDVEGGANAFLGDGHYCFYGTADGLHGCTTSAAATGRGCRTRRRAIALVCCSTSIRAAWRSGRTT